MYKFKNVFDFLLYVIFVVIGFGVLYVYYNFIIKNFEFIVKL